MKISVVSDHGKYRFHVRWFEPNTPNKKPTRKDILGRLFDDKKRGNAFSGA